MDSKSDSEDYVIFENRNEGLQCKINNIIKEQKQMKDEIKEIKVTIENIKYDFTKKLVKILNCIHEIKN